jgi:hypothetical protein
MLLLPFISLLLFGLKIVNISVQEAEKIGQRAALVNLFECIFEGVDLVFVMPVQREGVERKLTGIKWPEVSSFED